MKRNIRQSLKSNKGITLIALVVTLIVLLILAAVSLSAVFSEKGIFSRAENAGNKYNEAKAREVLETVLMADAQYEKHSNTLYNQDDYLDDLITNEIPEAEIKGDIVIIGDYAFELDRSVPKIGKNALNPKDLIWPVVTVEEVTQADPTDNYRTATINITATIDEKAENGINRIEIWQNGIKLETITCNNEKTVTAEYTANRNGVYTIKAYSKIIDVKIPITEILGSARTTVEGIVSTVEFTPNGSTEWKKSHTTKVTVKETTDPVKEMKYLWKKSDEGEPQASDFTESCTNNSTITGQGENMTGKYYLWVLVTMGTGTSQRTYISGSEEFYFDNEGPEIKEFVYNSITPTSYNLSCEAKDTYSQIAKYEIYIDNNCVAKLNTDKNSYTTSTFDEVKSPNTRYEIKVYDELGNSNTSRLTNGQQIQIWKKYEMLDRSDYKCERTGVRLEEVPLDIEFDEYDANCDFYYFREGKWSLSYSSGKGSNVQGLRNGSTLRGIKDGEPICVQGVWSNETQTATAYKMEIKLTKRERYEIRKFYTI